MKWCLISYVLSAQIEVYPSERPVSIFPRGWFSPTRPSLVIRCWGIIVLKAELKSTKTFQTCAFSFSRSSRVNRRGVDTALSVERFVMGWRGTTEVLWSCLSKRFIVVGVSATEWSLWFYTMLTQRPSTERWMNIMSTLLSLILYSDFKI